MSGTETRNITPATGASDPLSILLRGETGAISSRTGEKGARQVMFYAGCIFLGSGLYGATMGWWRSPEQGLFVAVKFPLIIFLTAAGNALVNGMIAPQLRVNISFRQSVLAVLMSFTVTSAILGAFSPLIAFMTWNAPPLQPNWSNDVAYEGIKLVHVGVIAFAGAAGNARLLQLLVKWGGPEAGRKVLCAWLATNLFLGTQLTWIFRPFIGTPTMPVQFLRDGALHGSFYENIFHSFLRVLNH